jgi:hypothetical protein
MTDILIMPQPAWRDSAFLDTQGGGEIALEAKHDDTKCFMFVCDKDVVM